MDDKKYFAQYKKSFETLFLADSEEVGFLKNVDFKYQAVTDSFLKMLQADSAKTILNKTLEKFSEALPESAQELIMKSSEQDLQIQKDRIRKICLEVIHCEGKVDGQVACECDCTFAIMDPKNS